MTIGIAQAAKPPCIPVGLTVMPGNTNDSKHMTQSYAQVKDVRKGYEHNLRCECELQGRAGSYPMGNNFLTGKKLNKSDDRLFQTFSEDTWRRMDKERVEILSEKEVPPSRVNYCFFSREPYDPNMSARKKKADRLYREAVSLQADLDKGKKLKRMYGIGNDLIEAHITLQTKLRLAKKP